MKKILLTLPVLALALCACTTELDYISDRDSELIVLNASLRTDRTDHVVWLSKSRADGIVKLSDARLRCYINGKLVAEAEEEATNPTESASRYLFSAQIQPGDEVRLEASQGGLKASATAVAPRPATLVGVDTVSIASSPYFVGGNKTYPHLACKLGLQDLPDQPNWFRLFVHCVENPVDIPEYKNDRSIKFGFNRDPILNEGKLQLDDYSFALLSTLTYEQTTYCKFRDTEFADKTAEVEIHIDFTDIHSFISDHPLMEENIYFDFLTISKEEYDYLVQYEKANSDPDLAMLHEPVHIPSNVEGGMGFFSVAAVSTRSIRILD